MKKVFVTMLVVILAIATAIGLNKTVLKDKTPAFEVATLLKPAKNLGHFQLDSTQDKPFTDQSFSGHWTVMFFGYATCPKICPQALALMSEVWRSYPGQKPNPNAQFVFVSLNPDKDSVDNLKTFLGQFHPDFIGLTGPKAEIVRLSTASGVFSWTAPAEEGSDVTIIDHSASILVISPEGRLKALFSPPHDAIAIAKDLKALMVG